MKDNTEWFLFVVFTFFVVLMAIAHYSPEMMYFIEFLPDDVIAN